MEVNKNQTSDEQKQVSVLEGDHGFHFSKILSRESSVGRSSHIYYRSAEGVPFKWEKLPGTPKNLPEEEEIIPPPSPSPLMQSLVLPKPCVDHHHNPKDHDGSKVWFWRKIKKIQQKNVFQGSRMRNDHTGVNMNKSDKGMRSGDSDQEFTGSCMSSSSSFSSSSSSSVQLHRDSREGQFSCTPFISSILVRATRRV